MCSPAGTRSAWRLKLPGWINSLRAERLLALRVVISRAGSTKWPKRSHVGATASDHSESDRINREAFEEVFRFLKLAWGDEPFRFKGKYYEYPSPQEGTPWQAHEWTREAGFPGEVDEQGRIQKINVVPKPYQRPHPPLFQAFSASEETVRWCAREGITPTILISQPPKVRKLVEAYHMEAQQAGRDVKFGENVGVLHAMYLAENKEQAAQIGRGRHLRCSIPELLLSFRLF